MGRVAIIGTGIAGMGCAHFLAGKHELTIYEKNDYVGGHTNTVTIEEEGRGIPVDTGFIVYNEVTYPNLTSLFRTLGVPTTPTSMSFSVQHTPSGLEWSGTGFNGLFAQRKNLFRPWFYRFLAEVRRFNSESVAILDDPGAIRLTLDEYARSRGYSRDFLDRYLIPMSSAVWSTEPRKMLDFPAVALVRFFRNHGFLGLRTQHQWRTVVGGSREYRDRLIAPFRERIHCSRPAVKVARQGAGAVVTDSGGGEGVFDAVILACHADEALALLDRPTDMEASLLGRFPYQKNIVTIHTDPSVMPVTRRAWSSWNYRLKLHGGIPVPSTVYYMNSLQKLPGKRDYFISIGDPESVRPDAVLRTMTYEHPVFTVGALQAQKDLPRLNEGGPLYFCGSYFRYGFHEDALDSAMDAVHRLTGEEVRL